MHTIALILLIAVTYTDTWWTINFQPHPHNRWIRLITKCLQADEVRYQALALFEITGDTRRLDVMRHRLPANAKVRCHVQFDLVRSENADAIPEETLGAEVVVVEVRE